ncbi:hypothetical protein [Tengunoibacter tsumagoiensis]|uniref:Uncharacterized protein n=1 Tax=Tengunoibacter tsumagoiensis TaxID=2014871 RepID=A0A402A9P6_9CHLR|nr:hypothetical protein [Tengunoibacter tsumagoiensis]GCE15849.1 hypothetical protein KTT_57080 [Tengunoibacter tsumagoiensis]
MHGVVVSPLTAWQNFYVIVGSAAAALTGLMFVVVTLIVSLSIRRSNSSIAAFGTPTVVHFCVTLLIAALLCAPWQELWLVSLMLGLIGLGGVLYIANVTRIAMKQEHYRPVFEDWLCHTVLPFIAYLALFVAAIVFLYYPVNALFIVGAVTLIFLFVGIHNSWDTVTFITLESYKQEQSDQARIEESATTH